MRERDHLIQSASGVNWISPSFLFFFIQMHAIEDRNWFTIYIYTCRYYKRNGEKQLKGEIKFSWFNLEVNGESHSSVGQYDAIVKQKGVNQ